MVIGKVETKRAVGQTKRYAKVETPSAQPAHISKVSNANSVKKAKPEQSKKQKNDEPKKEK